MSLDEDNHQIQQPIASSIGLGSGTAHRENLQQDFDGESNPKQVPCTDVGNPAPGARPTVKENTISNIDVVDSIVSDVADDNFMHEEILDDDQSNFHCTCLDLWAKKIARDLTDDFISVVIHVRDNLVIGEDGRQSMDVYLSHLDVLRNRIIVVRSAIVKELKGSHGKYIRLLPDKVCGTKHRVPEDMKTIIFSAMGQAIKEFRIWVDEKPKNDPIITLTDIENLLTTKPVLRFTST